MSNDIDIGPFKAIILNKYKEARFLRWFFRISLSNQLQRHLVTWDDLMKVRNPEVWFRTWYLQNPNLQPSKSGVGWIATKLMNKRIPSHRHYECLTQQIILICKTINLKISYFSTWLCFINIPTSICGKFQNLPLSWYQYVLSRMSATKSR